MKKLILYAIVTLFISSCTNNSDSQQKGSDKIAKTGHERHQMEAPSSSKRKYIDSVNNGLIEKDTLKGSPEMVAMMTIGNVHLHVVYSSPGVKERVIWGGLVPYDKVWVTGAHKATSIEISNPITIGNKKIEAGKYAIFTIPGKREWVFILNKNHKQHLADDYKETEDVVRLNVIPTQHTLTQRLRYSIDSIDANRGAIVVEWEKLRIEVPFGTLK